MTNAFFTNQIARLRKEYSDRAYGEERVKVLWMWAKKTNETLFEMTITEAIGNCSQAPLKSKLLEIYNDIRVKNPQFKTRYDCIYCDGFGWIADGVGIPTAYRCRCKNGESMSAAFQQWKGILVRISPTKADLEWRNVSKVINDTMKGIDQ